MTKQPFCKVNSRIKLKIMTKPGQLNETWYSPLKHNKRSVDSIIAGMKRRFLNSKYVSVAQVLLFYDNQADTLIEKHVA